MPKKILVVGAGFAGFWSALGAARLISQAQGASDAIEVALIAPSPVLNMRPRFYEASPSAMSVPLLPLLDAAGLRFIQGEVLRIHPGQGTAEAITADGERFDVAYDRLVLAAGSKVYRPELPGLREYSFSIDQIEDACVLDDHLRRLARMPATRSRSTVVVVGAGFTGIELATELPQRLRGAWGNDAAINVILIEQAPDVGPDLGPGPRPVIEQALRELGIDYRVNTKAAAIDAGGLTTSNGDLIKAQTVIWTAGPRASSLTRAIDAERDRLGRLHVDANLRVAGNNNIYAAGDVAFAATDDDGHYALMSCQHALMMGRYAGYNVAADILGLPAMPYRQTRYGTCLDLGGWGAVLTEGWEREVKMAGAEAKTLKRMINTQVIYPPPADRAALFAAADPAVKLLE
jgi:NADH dehydrogenase